MTGVLSGQYLGRWFDVAIALLLIATIGYAVILNRKLSELRGAKQEMEQLLGGFTSATERAEASLSALREAAGETGEMLQDGIIKGNAVADDLVFLIERAGPIADRLEVTPGRAGATAGPVRDELPPGARGDPDPAEIPAFAATSDTADPENALIKALRGVR